MNTNSNPISPQAPISKVSQPRFPMNPRRKRALKIIIFGLILLLVALSLSLLKKDEFLVPAISSTAQEGIIDWKICQDSNTFQVECPDGWTLQKENHFSADGNTVNGVNYFLVPPLAISVLPEDRIYFGGWHISTCDDVSNSTKCAGGGKNSFMNTHTSSNNKEVLSVFDALVSKLKLKEETVGWKTYRNEKCGFEVSYPGNWSLFDRGNFLQSPYKCNVLGNGDFVVSSPSQYDWKGYEKVGVQYVIQIFYSKTDNIVKAFSQGFEKNQEPGEQAVVYVILSDLELKSRKEFNDAQRIVNSFKFIK